MSPLRFLVLVALCVAVLLLVGLPAFLLPASFQQFQCSCETEAPDLYTSLSLSPDALLVRVEEVLDARSYNVSVTRVWKGCAREEQRRLPLYLPAEGSGCQVSAKELRAGDEYLVVAIGEKSGPRVQALRITRCSWVQLFAQVDADDKAFLEAMLNWCTGACVGGRAPGICSDDPCANGSLQCAAAKAVCVASPCDCSASYWVGNERVLC